MTMSCLCVHQPLAGFEAQWEMGVNACHEFFTQYVAMVPSPWQHVSLVAYP